MEDRRRFGQSFVQRHRATYGNRAPERRPLTYDIAVEDNFEPWRQWYEEQLALLPQTQADELAGKLWLDRHFWPVTFELAAGAAIRRAGYTAVYERDHDGLTPDWTAVNPDGTAAFILEVHTDQPPTRTFERIRGWKALEQRIATIPVGVVLRLHDRRPVAPEPPDAGTAKKIVRELRARLLDSPGTAVIQAHGYTFTVVAGRFGPIASDRGLRAQFASPSAVAGPVEASRLARAADAKVSRYAAIAERYEVPLVVAVGAHRFTRVDLSDVDDLLAGAPTISFQFNPGDTFIGSTTINLARPQRWKMPADLACLLWLHNQPPFAATARPNPDARRPLPQQLLLATPGGVHGD
ncbi:hypothetical protein KBX37_24720 [Micromonospora sp. U56]|uniref:hypothetical protein n=1 Tax=Micromonospora sp. U56 TaxID=2824900 RepID=UPI001B39420D|nr:hypothetical protein [Micromonospora sp. U56]MBQ0896257.1 hypothetical protein [Micromonospora sp. U56]